MSNQPLTKPEQLINTKFAPGGYSIVRFSAGQARGYHELDPYPYFAFYDWRTEERGPLPICIPIERMVSRKLSLWLFGRPIKFRFLDEKVTKFVNHVWKINGLNSRMRPASERAGYEGSLAIKWSFDAKDPKQVTINILPVLDTVFVYTNPVDVNEVWMVRIEYPFFNSLEGNWYLYREEWTATKEVRYKPYRLSGPPSRSPQIHGRWSNPYALMYDGKANAWDLQWEIDKVLPNPAGVIPVALLKNINVGDAAYGRGYCWGLHRLTDRLNLTYHLMDRSNQMDSDPFKVFLDVEDMENEDAPQRSMQPGEALSLQSIENEDGTVRKGDVKLLETQGLIRAPMEIYARDLKSFLFEAAGIAFPRLEDITNKGGLTSSVMTQVHSSTIETVNEGRKSLGSDGLVPFFQNMIIGLKNLGVKELPAFESPNDEELMGEVCWHEYFVQTEDEKYAVVDRLRADVEHHFLPLEVAIDKVAHLEEVPDEIVSTYREELIADRDESRELKQEQAEQVPDNTKLRDEPNAPKRRRQRQQKSGRGRVYDGRQ